MAVSLAAVLVVAVVSPTAAQEPGCPLELDGLSLDVEARDTSDSQESLNCSYEPAEPGAASRVAMIATWVPAGLDASSSGFCGLTDFEDDEGVRWYGFDYSDDAAAQVWYNADDQTLGVDKDAVRATAAALLADHIGPLAQSCAGPTNTPPEDTAAPPPTTSVSPDTTTPATTSTTSTTLAAAVPVPVPASVCPQAIGELVLVSEVPETKAGVSLARCEYVSGAGSTRYPVLVTLRWGTPAAAHDDLPACGLSDVASSDRGYISSRTTAASAEYNNVVTEQASGTYEPMIEEAVRGILAAVEASAAPCGGPPTDISQVRLGVPPADIELEELAFYETALACEQSISGFVLNEPGRARTVLRDWVALDCDYTRSGVEVAAAQEQDTAILHVTWTKVNGRNARFCLDEASSSETDARVFASLYDGEHSVKITTAHPREGDALRIAFTEAATDLQARVFPLAYVCPDFNEIVFDPISPYWQAAFGSIATPPPIVLPDEVVAADVVSGAAYAGAAVEGTAEGAVVAIPPEPGAEPPPAGPTEVDDGPVATGAPDEANPGASQSPEETKARSMIWRVVGIGGLVLSILGLVVAILLIRKQSRVRPTWDNARLAIATVTIVVMTLVIAVDTPFLLIIVGIAVGVLIGLLQGRNLEVRVSERGLHAKRSIIAAVAFAVGLVIVQIAGFANRNGAVALGLTVSYLSAAMTAGLIVGRRQRIVDARAASMAFGVVLVVLAMTMGAPPRSAEAQDEGSDANREVLIDMVDWDEITVVGGMWAANGKPPLTISVPRGLVAAPEEITNTVAWVSGTTDFSDSYEITESYEFELDEDGRCCTVTIVADGTRLASNGVSSTHHAEAVIGIRPEGLGGFTGVTPFADPELFGGVDTENPPCGRPVAQVGLQDAEWTTRTIDGEPTGGGSVEFFLLTDCDLPDFTVSNALAIAPPPPAGPDQRMQGDQGPCPVLQEIVGPIAEASGIDSGATYTVGRLYTQPNVPVCDEGLALGDFRPGGLQMSLLWSLATDNVEAEVERINEINDDFIRTTRQYGIYDEDACRLDANGDILPPAEGEECKRRQFFAVGSEVTIWTEYSGDGPNVEVRGRFPWGSYWFFCHHCEPGDRMIRDAVAAWHRAGVSAAAAAADDAAADPADADRPEGASTGSAVEEFDDLADPSVEELGDGVDPSADDDIDARDAAIAALVALLGSAALAGAALTESGTSIRDLSGILRQGGIDVPGDIPPDGVTDERGNVLVPGDDGRYDWETPNGVERLDRADLEARIAAERAAITARGTERTAILKDHADDASAANRMTDLTERSISQNDELMADIRDGWGRVDEMQSALDERSRILGDLELAESERDYATARSSWDQIALGTAEGAGRDIAGLPGEIVDATRFVVNAAADIENWRIAGETLVETAYDSAGMIAGNTFGDGAESVGNGARFTADVAAALGTSFVRDPLGTIVMLTPVQDFIDATDGERSLGRRLGSIAIGIADIGLTVSGLGVLNAGDDLIDAARAAERLGEVANASSDAARATEAAFDGSRVAGRLPDTALDPALLRVRQDVDRAIDAARAEAAARGVPVTEVLNDVPEVRSLYRGDGLERLGRLEAAGGLDNKTAAAVLSIHDEITGGAIRVGTETSIDDMMRLHGVRPQQVIVGNSGSVGVTRSVMTDADRTVVTVFGDADLDLWRARTGGTRGQAAQDLQDTYRDLHRRNAELALNDPTDPAVRLARESNMSLGEAAAHLDTIGADDATAAARRLTGGEMDMASYSGFGSLTGPADSYPAGFTRARMSIQGNADVYRVSSNGSVSSYRTSGQAIIDQHELERVRHTGAVTTVDVGDGIRVADPTRIPDAELGPLLNQQVMAIEHYDDVKSVAKAVDRVQYIAGRSGRSLADASLVEASISIRANPRGTASILAELGMSEQQFVDATKTMVRDYGTGG